MRSTVNQFNVTNEIVAILDEDAQLAELTDNRFFPIDAPKDTAGNFIVYQRDGYKQMDTKTGIARRQPQVWIHCVSDKYKDSQRMASLVFEALSGRFTHPDMVIELEDCTEDWTGQKYIQSLLFTVTI